MRSEKQISALKKLKTLAIKKRHTPGYGVEDLDSFAYYNEERGFSFCLLGEYVIETNHILHPETVIGIDMFQSENNFVDECSEYFLNSSHEEFGINSEENNKLFGAFIPRENNGIESRIELIDELINEE